MIRIEEVSRNWERDGVWRIAPEGTEYWFVDPAAHDGVYLTQFDNYEYEHKRIKRRMAYLDHEHALIAARHIFGLKGGEL